MQPRYFNRELSWLEFNLRVLEEAMDEGQPLLERVKFLAIFHSNLDEFFMIRVSGLTEQVQSGIVEPSEDGLTPREQLDLIYRRVNELSAIATEYMRDRLLPELARAGIFIHNYSDLSKEQKTTLKEYFDTTVYPVLSPLAVDPGHPFPHISNLSLSLAVVLRGAQGEQRFARVKIPGVLPRLLPITLERREDEGDIEYGRKYGFVWLEQLVAAHLDTLFSGVQVEQSYAFRVIRDADLEIREDEAGDLLQTIENSLQRRRFGAVTQLITARDMPENIVTLLTTNLEITPSQVYTADVPLGVSELMSLYDLELPELKDPPIRPRTSPLLRDREDLFATIRNQDVLLHHPYDSFGPVVEFIQAASNDPNVLAIKQTIYRVGSNSPIVEALAEASQNGKQVAVLVELKARFDEENNIEWARALEKAGVHVVYGSISLKTHCKVALVVRREGAIIRRYVHLGTGNYNAKTSRMYTDLGLFTCNPAIGADVSALFNALTGYSPDVHYHKLLVSPQGIRSGLIERIHREIEHAKAGREAHIVFKINAASDFGMTDAIYEASQTGVRVDLIVRGSCTVVPGLEGLSENVRVISVVGRFLEHSRMYYFRNGGGGHEEVWLGSADLMQRNLDRRVETLFPIEDPTLRNWLLKQFLSAYMKDNQKARTLQSDGRYVDITNDGEPFSCQDWFIEHTPTEVLVAKATAKKRSAVVRVLD